jgi:4-carboxymuconolactone decarboxylase
VSETSARIEKLVPAGLDEDQRALYDAIAGGPRAQGPQLFRLTDADGGLEGPFNAFLLQPHLGLPLQELGAAVRYRTTLSDRAREIAILVVAIAHDSAFERHAHEAVGRHAGLTDAELQALREDDLSALDSPTEQAVATTTRALVTRGDLDDGEYAAAVDALGVRGVFELTTLVGYYATLALQLRVFRVGAPAT